MSGRPGKEVRGVTLLGKTSGTSPLGLLGSVQSLILTRANCLSSIRSVFSLADDRQGYATCTTTAVNLVALRTQQPVFIRRDDGATGQASVELYTSTQCGSRTGEYKGME
jgi:hypothetical protein